MRQQRRVVFKTRLISPHVRLLIEAIVGIVIDIVVVTHCVRTQRGQLGGVSKLLIQHSNLFILREFEKIMQDANEYARTWFSRRPNFLQCGSRKRVDSWLPPGERVLGIIQTPIGEQLGSVKLSNPFRTTI